MVGMPDGVSPRNDDGLRGLVRDSKVLFEGVGKLSIFDDQDHTAWDIRVIGEECLELFIGHGTPRTLRAMLEEHDRFFLRTLEKRAQVLFLVEFNEHDRRVTDGTMNEEQRIAWQGNHR
jgi:hypothetical protein